VTPESRMQDEQSGRNDSEPHQMSLEIISTSEPSHFLSGEGRRHPSAEENSLHSLDERTGGVCGGGMAGKDSGVSREASADIWLHGRPETSGASTANPRKTGGVSGGVGDAHSSDDACDRTTRAERRGGACPGADRSKEGREDGGVMPIITSEKVRHLQRTLYRKAKGEARWRAWSLYGDLCRRDVLEEALRHIMANNGAPGVDGMNLMPLKGSAELREKFLRDLQGELKAKTYKPSPVRRVCIEKENGKKRPLGIPTVKDRVVQTAAIILLQPIFEADMHEHSYAYRPRRNARQAMDQIKSAILAGRTEMLDADLSAYFDSIPHGRLMKLVARRVSDGTMLGLIKAWLRSPIVERDEDGTTRTLPNKQGTPQGGVISPLLANLYLNDLDHAVPNRTQGHAVMVRYADDFVICCHPGKGGQIKARVQHWLEARGLKLNEEKTRLVNIRAKHASMNFLGFTLNWRTSRRTGNGYPHVEPSARSQKRLREKVREVLNRQSLWRAPEEVVAKVNVKVRGWQGYYHYANSSGVFAKLQNWMNERLARWDWRKHACSRSLWKQHAPRQIADRYGLHQLQLTAPWKNPTSPR
jgi:RNA-directed DNA polymerase